jgi:hypothetical protein
MRKGLGRLGSDVHKRQSKFGQRFFGNREPQRGPISRFDRVCFADVFAIFAPAVGCRSGTLGCCRCRSRTLDCRSSRIRKRAGCSNRRGKNCSRNTENQIHR